MKDLYNKNYKMLKEIAEDTSIWKNNPCSWMKIINIVKIFIQLKAIYKFNAILTMVPLLFCTEVEKPILELVWNYKRPWITQIILSRKNEAGNITIPDFKLYCKVIVIKTVWYWY